MMKGLIEMNKYEIRTAKKKHAIINAALELFNTYGFVNTNVSEIAKLANVSQVSIYNYFGSKEALVLECAKVIMKDTIEKAKDLLSQDINFVDKVELALHLCSDQIHVSLNQYLNKEALSDTTLRTHLNNSFQTIKRELYKDFIELGKKEGIIPIKFKTNLILNYIDSLSLIDMDYNNLVEEEEQIHEMFLYGLFGKNRYLRN